MPSLPMRPCGTPGCRQLLHPGDACPTHGRRDKSGDRDRGTSCERGYDYDWQQVRMMYLAANPFCQLRLRCADGPLTQQLAVEVHHVEPVRKRPDLRLEWSNLRSTCDPCHEAVRHQ